MPEQTLIELQRSLEAQQHLVAEVRALRIGNRRLLQLVLIGFAICALAIVGVVGAYTASNTANDAARHAQEGLDRLDQLVEDIQRDRAADAMRECQILNNVPRVFRDSQRKQIDTFAELLPLFGVDEQTIQAVRESLAGALPIVESTDHDCNGDRQLTVADYP